MTLSFDLEVTFDLELCEGHLNVKVKIILRSNAQGKVQGHEKYIKQETDYLTQ